MAHHNKGHAYVNSARTVNVINNFSPNSRSSSPFQRRAANHYADSRSPSAHCANADLSDHTQSCGSPSLPTRIPIDTSRSQSPARPNRSQLPQGRGSIGALFAGERMMGPLRRLTGKYAKKKIPKHEVVFANVYPLAPEANRGEFVMDGQAPRRRMGREWKYAGREDGLYGKHHLADRPELPDLPGRRKEYKGIRSRILNKLPPPMRLQRNEKIYNRPTKLCYGEAKRPVRCEHFIVAQEVRKCEEERRKLKYMYRMLELENDNYHPDDKGRSLIFDEIVEAILECDECLEELDTMKDPTDEERKRVFWRKEVAYRRLKTLDEMDFVDERIADQRKMNE
eukprot:GEMP01051007.1.p1 GENE.GEMP01051007.1~~GEMP01051007.1.p1  ORF type:complete len:339 (+),score=68.46 GEMP01051007.1:277-1293(+)